MHQSTWQGFGFGVDWRCVELSVQGHTLTISHFAKITILLTDLMKIDKPVTFPLTGDALNAFLRLQEAFTSTPVLTHHIPALPIFLFTDALDFTISRIPHQQDSAGNLHLLAFYSRKLRVRNQLQCLQ